MINFDQKCCFIYSPDCNELENRLNNQSNRQMAINNLNNVLVNNNLNLNNSYGGTNNLNNTGSLLICNNTPNNQTLASSSASPTSSTSTLQGKLSQYAILDSWKMSTDLSLSHFTFFIKFDRYVVISVKGSKKPICEFSK